MTGKEFRSSIVGLSHALHRDKDHFLFVHFSKIDDRYEAIQKLDVADALVIIEELIKFFNIDRKALAIMNVPETIKSEDGKG